MDFEEKGDISGVVTRKSFLGVLIDLQVKVGEKIFKFKRAGMI